MNSKKCEKEKICIVCGLEKKTVKKEGSLGCYLYGDKISNKHSRTLNIKNVKFPLAKLN